MLPWVVNSRLHPHQPLMCPTPRTSLLLQPACQCPLPPLCFQQLPTIKFHNSFVLITMQNAPPGGWYALLAPPSFTLVSLPLFSCTYERVNLQALCFQIFTTVGGGGYPIFHFHFSIFSVAGFGGSGSGGWRWWLGFTDQEGEAGEGEGAGDVINDVDLAE